MVDQDPARRMNSYAYDLESPQGPYSPVLPPALRDTQSTTSSGSPPPMIPPGFYTLPIHGNCPRCHHRHKAAAIRIRISGDLNQISHVNCERCGEKWLAVGGDPMDRGFRYTLVDMVRALTAVGSTAALASVPELPSGSPSREQSVRSGTPSTGQEDHQPNTAGEKPAASESARRSPSVMDVFHENPHTTQLTQENDSAPTTFKPKRIKSFISLLKSRLKDRFPIMKKLNPRRLSQSKRQPRMTAKGRGKLPIAQPSAMNPNVPVTTHTRLKSKDATPPGHKGTEDPKEEVDDTYKQGTIEAAGRFERDKERLKKMNNDQRAAWVREQFSDLKCRCPRNCYCGRTPPHAAVSSDQGHSTPSPPQVPLQLSPQFLAQRRRSTELFGVGGYFEGLNFVQSTRPLSIDSTRLSQAATVVSTDSITVTSRSPMPFLRVPQQQRQRPRSPRPQSLPVGSIPESRLQQLGQDEAEGRSSLDSFTTGGAVRSLAGTGWHGTNDYSTSSLVLTTNAVGVDGPSLQDMGQNMTTAHITSSMDNQSASPASTPHLNGYRTSDERNRDSLPLPRSHLPA